MAIPRGILLSRKKGSNLQPTHYECAALPLSYSGKIYMDKYNKEIFFKNKILEILLIRKIVFKNISFPWNSKGPP
jgi:hypothetical protein